MTSRFLLGLGAAGGGFLGWMAARNEERQYLKALVRWPQFLLRPSPQASCCGIVAYIGPQNVESILTEGIRILQNRGYDSCGIATIDPKTSELATTKFASRGTTSDSIDLLAAEAPKVHSNHHIGIAHTRWATHGAKTDINAHPHSDYKHRISLVHNGTIENYVTLKERLLKKNIPFITQTDTEVIANLIAAHLDAGSDVERAVQATCAELEGTWGLAVIHKDFPDQLVLARHGSPLLVGCSEREVFVASEPAALANHTNQFLSLWDGEICVLKPGGIEHLAATRTAEKIHLESIETSPAPYEHWTLKEICEQPESLARAMNYGGRIFPLTNSVKLGGLDCAVDKMMSIRHLILAGCGTSLHAAMYGERLMQALRCFDTVVAMDASEMTEESLPAADAGLLLLSQSGETLDTIRACQLAEKHNVARFSVVNVVGSLLARSTNCGVYLNAGREVAVASTKAFTSQATVLALIAVWFAQRRNALSDKRHALVEALHRLPIYSEQVLQCRPQIKKLAAKMKDATTLFVLGKGFAYPVAVEGALKIKEISYIHAEGFPGGALKHGPFALIEKETQTPVILIVPSDENAALMRTSAEQVKARGAFVIGIVDDESTLRNIADEQIVIPRLGFLTSLLATIPLQLLAYELSVTRGINPDKPRGLAKTVTVS